MTASEIRARLLREHAELRVLASEARRAAAQMRGGGGETALFAGDLVPTTAHLPLPWIMGYDVEPLVTLETKRRILARAAAEQWLLVFCHDATTAWGRIAHDGKAYTLAAGSG